VKISTALLVCAFCTTVLIAGEQQTLASTIFVSGPSSGIQNAIDEASNGDMIDVAPGTYDEDINFDGKSLTLESEDGANSTIIDNTVSGGTTVTIGGTAEIEGFTITGGSATFGAGMAVSGTGTIIQDNIFQYNNEGSGGYGAAIGGNGASPTITNNIFRYNSADSQLDSAAVSFVNGSSPTITNNIFYSNQTVAIDLTLPAGPKPVVANNTIYGNTGGISLNYFGSDIIANNIITGNGTGIGSSVIGQPASSFFNNLISGNTTDFSNEPNVIGTNGNIAGDPKFVNAAAGSFEIGAGSAAYEAGDAQYAPATDFDGVMRSLTDPSIGAFELEVPEPGTLGLIALGMMFVFGHAARFAKSRQPLP
jgi:serine protease